MFVYHSSSLPTVTVNWDRLYCSNRQVCSLCLLKIASVLTILSLFWQPSMLFFPKFHWDRFFFFSSSAKQFVFVLACWAGWNVDEFPFYIFSKAHIFQLYQDNGMVIMKGCVQWNPVYNKKDFCHGESNLGMLDQQTSASPTGLPGFPCSVWLCGHTLTQTEWKSQKQPRLAKIHNSEVERNTLSERNFKTHHLNWGFSACVFPIYLAYLGGNLFTLQEM